MTTPADPPADADDELRSRRRDRRLRAGVTAAFVVFTLAVFLGAVVRGRVLHPEKPINWLEVIGIVALIVLVDVLVMRLTFRHLMPLMTVRGVDHQATQRVSTQLRRGETVDEKDRGAATAFLEITGRQKWFPLFMVLFGLFLAFSAALELTHTPPRPLVLRVVNVVVALGVLAATVYLFLNRRRVLTNGARQGLLPGTPAAEPDHEHG